jgi:hypothetical protein
MNKFLLFLKLNKIIIYDLKDSIKMPQLERLVLILWRYQLIRPFFSQIYIFLNVLPYNKIEQKINTIL